MRDRVKRAVRKTVKWGGAGLTVLLVVVWIGSGWWSVSCSGSPWHVEYVEKGTLTVYVVNPEPPGHIRLIQTNACRIAIQPSDASARFPVWEWNPTYSPGMDWWFSWGSRHFGRFTAIPLWFPALLSLLATAAAWRADLKHIRRGRAGLCGSCGYDRAGLAAGCVCPECGAAPSV